MEGASVETNTVETVLFKCLCGNPLKRGGTAGRKSEVDVQESKHKDVNPEKATTWEQGWEEGAHLKELEMAPAGEGLRRDCRGASDPCLGARRGLQGAPEWGRKVFRTLSVPDWEVPQHPAHRQRETRYQSQQPSKGEKHRLGSRCREAESKDGLVGDAPQAGRAGASTRGAKQEKGRRAQELGWRHRALWHRKGTVSEVMRGRPSGREEKRKRGGIMRIDDSLEGSHKFKKRKQWVESWKRACSCCRERRRVGRGRALAGGARPPRSAPGS